MMGGLVTVLIIGTIAAIASTIPAVHHTADRLGAWLSGAAPFPRADVRLGAFLGVFMASAVILT